jgi:hypothetical protein
VAVIGGLLASTALSLFVVPVIFTITDDLQQWLRRVFSRKHEGHERANTVQAAES